MTDPSPSRARARAVFLEAVRLAPDDRPEFVRSKCGGDEALEREVLALLDADDPEFLGRPALERAGVTAPSEKRVPAPERIGPYRLLAEIGEGGMGVVHLAEQDEPVRRRVALKLIKPGMDSRRILERFDAERNALARMDHPGIARVFDAGTTAAGHPYFVMEHVAGVSVTQYCDRHRLSIRARVELMIEICDAVQHAHQKGIIHRDLKSSNVLVTVSGDRAVPKIIDFGLAKAIGPSPDERSEFTWIGGVIGTLETMSPEQAGATGLDIDTRADVYSLGVLLYEMLCGALPVERHVVEEALLTASPARLFESDPPAPSARAAALRDLAGVAAVRRTTPAGLVRRLRGDLDRICAMAMEHDRTRRYATPTAFAQDLVRHLADEPILAAPPRLTYRVAKFVKRRKDVVTSIALVLGVLIGAVVATSRAQLEAEREAAHARQMTGFLTWAFTSVDPNLQVAHPDLKVIELLKRAADELDRGFLVDVAPEVEARIRAVLGETMFHLGRLGEAEPLLRESFESFREIDPDAVATLEAANLYGLLLIDRNRPDEAEPLLRDALARWESVADPGDPGVVKARNAVASVLFVRGALDEAEAMQRETLEMIRSSGRADDEATQHSLLGLGRLLARQGRYAEARDLLRELLQVQRRTRGEEHPDTLRTMNALAEMLGRTGDVDGAEDLWRETHERMTRVLGSDHPLSLRVGLNIGEWTTRVRRDPARAEPLLRTALEGAERTLDRDHPLLASARYDLGECLYEQQRMDEAEPYLRDTVDWIRRHRGITDAGALSAMARLRRIWICQGRLADVEAACRELLDAFGDEEGRASLRGSLLVDLAVCRRYRLDHDGAVEALRAALAGGEGVGGKAATLAARDVLAQCLIDAGHLDEAEHELTALEAECLRSYGEVADPVLRLRAIRGSLLAARGRTAEAERTLRDVLSIAEEHGHPATPPWIAGRLGRLLLLRGAPEEARPHLERAFEELGRLVGERHPAVRRAGEEFVRALEESGDDDGAAALRRRLD